jgi:excisionase family DNA binding protein
MRTQSADGLQPPTTGCTIAVSPAEAAQLIGIGRTKLYEALNSGALPSYRIGCRRVILVAELEDWIRAHAVKSATERAATAPLNSTPAAKRASAKAQGASVVPTARISNRNTPTPHDDTR